MIGALGIRVDEGANSSPSTTNRGIAMFPSNRKPRVGAALSIGAFLLVGCVPAAPPDDKGVAEVNAASLGCPPGTTRQCVFDPEVRAWTCECVPTPPPPPPPPPPGSGAVSLKDWTDASGKVHVRVYQGPWSPVSSHPMAACLVEPDRVLVGGGAEIENGEGRVPGALLVGSWPAGADPNDH